MIPGSKLQHERLPRLFSLPNIKTLSTLWLNQSLLRTVEGTNFSQRSLVVRISEDNCPFSSHLFVPVSHVEFSPLWKGHIPMRIGSQLSVSKCVNESSNPCAWAHTRQGNMVHLSLTSFCWLSSTRHLLGCSLCSAAIIPRRPHGWTPDWQRRRSPRRNARTEVRFPALLKRPLIPSKCARAALHVPVAYTSHRFAAFNTFIKIKYTTVWLLLEITCQSRVTGGITSHLCHPNLGGNVELECASRDRTLAFLSPGY